MTRVLIRRSLAAPAAAFAVLLVGSPPVSSGRATSTAPWLREVRTSGCRACGRLLLRRQRPERGTTYHYVVTAVDGSANESQPSAEVSTTPEPGHREPRARLPGPRAG